MASQPMIDLTPPSWDPKDVYPPLPEALKSVDFDLSKRLKDRFQSHLSREELEDRSEALKKTLEYLQTQKSNFIGYQVNHKIDYIEDIQSFIKIHLNNIGDAFQEANLTTSTKFMERAVLDYYASLWNAKWPHNDDRYADPEGDSFWGFLLTMGSTEGNMYAMWNARDYLSGKVLIIENDPSIGRQPRMVYRQAEVPPVDAFAPYFGADGSALKLFRDNYYSPVMFYSEDTHYSFTKASILTSLPTFGSVGNEKYPEQCPIKTADGKWPDEVPSNDDGTINIDKLSILVDFFAQQGHPVLISLNYGSTFKGAYDNVEEVAKALAPIFTKYHMWNRDCCLLEDKIERRGFWIHVDGALGASYMPYLRMALQDPRYKLKDGSAIPLAPAFDFGVTVDSKGRKEEMVHSISVSGHKWIGAPFPCGVYMSKRRYQITPPSNPTYIGTPDTTFAGSRNGLSALLLWSYLSKKTLHQQIEKAVYCENMASSINEKMTKLGEWLKNEHIIDDLWVARTPQALTVRFRQLNKDLTLKYSLSNESLMVDGEVRYYSHVFSMEHVTDQLVDQLVNEIKSLGKNAFADQSVGKIKPAGLPSPLDSARLIATVPFKGRGFS